MGPDLVVVTPPLLDAHAGVDAIPKPPQAEILVAELAVERFVAAILPPLAGIDEGRLDLRRLEPPENRAAYYPKTQPTGSLPNGRTYFLTKTCQAARW